MTKVLVVDDSALMRRMLGGMLFEAGLEVAMARNGIEGLQQLSEWKPDVVTLDINMPEMDGLTALSLMMQARPTPTIMVSSLTERGTQATLEALALGAVDYIAKPGGTISLNLETVAQELVAKVRGAAKARLRSTSPAVPKSRQRPRPIGEDSPRTNPESSRVLQSAGGATRSSAVGQVPGVVVIGVSTGGPRTLEDILPALPADFPWPVLIAQHMPPNFTEVFARRMDGLCPLHVREVSAAMPLEPGHVYVARGGGDMVLADRLGRLIVQPCAESAVHPWHPSVDRLMESALRCVRPEQLVGVLLTGMGNDGAEQMARLHGMGGRTIAESADTAVVFGMPQELIVRRGATTVLPATAIGRQLTAWIALND